MGPTLLNRRRTERFAQLIDEADGGRRHRLRSSLDPELASLVTLRREIARLAPSATPTSEFRAQLRASLIATAQRDGIETTVDAPKGRRAMLARLARLARLRGRGPGARIVLATGVALSAMAFAGMSQASERAVPGDPLYGLKRSTERAQLALAASDVGRGELYLDFARTRLVEAATLSGDLTPTLDDMDQATVAGVSLLTNAAVGKGDLSILGLIDDFAADQHRGLAELEQGRDGPQHRITTSVTLLDSIIERSTRLRQGLGCSAMTTVRVDDLGPLLDDCTAPASPTSGTEPQRRPSAAPSPPSQPADDGDPTSDQLTGPENPTPSAKPPAGDGPTAPTPPPPDSNSAPEAPPEAEAEPEAQPEAEPEQTDDGGSGLLGGLRRLIGGLLGG